VTFLALSVNLNPGTFAPPEPCRDHKAPLSDGFGATENSHIHVCRECNLVPNLLQFLLEDSRQNSGESPDVTAWYTPGSQWRDTIERCRDLTWPSFSRRGSHLLMSRRRCFRRLGL